MGSKALVTVQVIFDDRWTAAELEGIKAKFDAGDDRGEFLGWLRDQVNTDPNVMFWDYAITDPTADEGAVRSRLELLDAMIGDLAELLEGMEPAELDAEQLETIGQHLGQAAAELEDALDCITGGDLEE